MDRLELVVMGGEHPCMTESIRGREHSCHIQQRPAELEVQSFACPSYSYRQYACGGGVAQSSNKSTCRQLSHVHVTLVTPQCSRGVASTFAGGIVGSYPIYYRAHRSSGLAHFRFSIRPVFGHRISCQETGSIVAPTNRHSRELEIAHTSGQMLTCFARCEDHTKVVPCGSHVIAASVT